MADDYEAPRILDKALNEAILSYDISFDFLPFIDLCHRHYADEVDLSFGEVLGALSQKTRFREC